MALKLENVESAICNASEGGNQPSSSISRGQNNELAKSGVGNIKSDHEKVKSSSDDYDSVLSEFYHFASKGTSEAVGYGYEIGDMVWGMVKSHPWWPGHIYNEAFALPSVRRSKHEGHVLVAFFGDSSYGWFEPAELVPFEENFVEKSRQTSSRAFVKAVEEALDELSRRRSLGLACRCRNEFNFWPSSIKGYFTVDVGDYEPVVYSTSQIDKARESFHPNEMLSFVQKMALTPMTHQHGTLEFIKNKATVLACRKALFEEFDETYAQAFGTVPVRPPRPTAPASVNPSKAPLSGRLVFAEAREKCKQPFVKPTRSKDQLEKDKYIFKRRDEPVHVKAKKTGPAQLGGALFVDGSGLSGTPTGTSVKSHKNHGSTNQASVVSDTKPSEGSMKLVEVGMKKGKLHKKHAENGTSVVKKRKKEILTTGELSGEGVTLDEKTKKRKKDMRSEVRADMAKLPVANSDSGASAVNVSEMPLNIPLATADNQLDNQKNSDLVTSSEAKQAAGVGKVELQVLVQDLHALAIDPFHGVERIRQATTRLAFLKYRSLVYQKSSVSSPQTEIETREALHVPPEKTNEKSTLKLARPLVRTDDPTKGGKKHGSSDRPEPIKKKKKLEDTDGINRKKKLVEVKKKKKMLDASKALSVQKKIPQRSTESPKVVKLESSKKADQPRKARTPTMLMMKFPPGASLPSGAHLRAKFARFGPLDYTGTRVFWNTFTCRLVFLHKIDAEDALNFARESGDLFGSTNVRSYIKEVGPMTAESEPIKTQKEDASAAEAPLPRDAPAKMAVQPSQKLKSCLKKPSGEEVGNGNNGRGSRVKFVLGGEQSTNSEQHNNYSADITSNNLPKINPPSNEMQKIPSNRPSVVKTTPVQEIPDVPKNDISQQFLHLLIRCNDVVNNVKGVLGYVPYHPL